MRRSGCIDSFCPDEVFVTDAKRLIGRPLLGALCSAGTSVRTIVRVARTKTMGKIPGSRASRSLLPGQAMIEKLAQGEERLLRVGDEDVPSVSRKIMRLLSSYVEDVNCVVWQ